MFKKRFKRKTPFLLIAAMGAIVLLYEVIIERGGPDGWRYPLLLKFFGYWISVLLMDVLLKHWIKNKTYLIWLVECFLLLVIFYLWIIAD
jgi:hypothetical protein